MNKRAFIRDFIFACFFIILTTVTYFPTLNSRIWPHIQGIVLAHCFYLRIMIKNIPHCVNKHRGNFRYSLVTKGPVLLQVNPFKSEKERWTKWTCTQLSHYLGQNTRLHVLLRLGNLDCSFYSSSLCRLQAHQTIRHPPFFSSVLILDANAEPRSNWVLSWWL